MKDSLIHPANIRYFLSLYDAALEACDARLALFSLPAAATYASRDPDAVVRQAVAWTSQKRDVYFHIHLHDLPDGHLRSRGSAETLRAAIGLFEDVDARGPGRKKPPETLCPTVNDAILLVEEFNAEFAPLGASLVINSGYGCYPAILFREPLLAVEAEDRQLLESLGRRFHLALQTIAARHRWTGAVDYCDPAKVLRLPGTEHYKDPDNPRPVQLVHENAAARFALADLDELLPPLPGRKLFSGSDAEGQDSSKVAIVINFGAQLTPEFINLIRESHPDFAASLENQRPDLDDQSCSGYDMSIADFGVNCGLPDQRIADLLVAHRAQFPGPKRIRRGRTLVRYLQRTIARARDGKQSSEDAQQEWETFEAALKSATSGTVAPDAQPLYILTSTTTPDQPASTVMTNEAGSASATSPDEEVADQVVADACVPDAPNDAPAVTPAGNEPTNDDAPGPGMAVPEPPERPSETAPGSEAEQASPQPGADTEQTVGDADGKNHDLKPKVPDSVKFLVAKIEATSDYELVYNHIDQLAVLSEAEVAVVYQRLKAALGTKLDRAHFDKALAEARARTRQDTAKTTESKNPREPLHPYRQIHGGIFRVKKTKDGGEEYLPLTNFVAKITSDITEDDGVQTQRFLGISTMAGRQPHSFIVPASEFTKMDWVLEAVGPHAIVHPNQKDWARAGIQSLSTEIKTSKIFIHTGWSRVGGSMLYLHGKGAIGKDGAVPNIDVRLSGAMANYELLLPENREQLTAAVRASLRVLDLAPAHVAFPVQAAPYRAAIRSCDFGMWLSGPTGVFKSEQAALAQQHYGAAMNARRLPANFASTGNSLEVLAFTAKDALLVIDDFAPSGSSHDVARYHSSADRILRAAGNNQGRGRLSSDARLKDAKPPRGLILATGEDLPRGQSIRGRTLIVEVAPGDVNTAVLTECQMAAASGAYARAMGGFIQWIAGQYESIQAEFQVRLLELRSQVTKVHSRTPGIVADLCAGFELFLRFAATTGAISASEQQELGERCWAALNRVAKAQQVQHQAAEPTFRFLELIRAAIFSGQAHVARLDGGAPAGEGQWGWQMVGSGDHERPVSKGKCVGWLEGSNLYLEPAASFGVAQEIGRASGEQLAVSEITLRKRLNEKGLLASTDSVRATLTVRRKICGESIPVIHLRADVLSNPSTSAQIETTDKEGFSC